MTLRVETIATDADALTPAPPTSLPAPIEARSDTPETLTRTTQFTILHPHASGGLGTVSIARDEAMGRQVALKQIRPEIADDSRSRLRFLHEAEITGQLEHPGIIPVYALGLDSHGRPYYAMKFVHGRTLAEGIIEYHAHPTPLAFQDLLRRFIAVCQAIAYAHERAVIHRDLKPANIMLGQYGETLILDWGLAKRIGTTDAPESDMPSKPASAWMTRDGAVVGTPSYMSPEQAAGQVELHGPAADIYSLGAILYQILTSTPPHSGGSASEVLSKVQETTPPSPRSLRSGVPRPLEAICLKAMSNRAEDRYPSAKALAEDVERYLADERVTACREPITARAARWARRHRVIVAAAAALLITAAAALLVSNVLIRREQGHTAAALGRAVAGETDAMRQRKEAESQRASAELRLAQSLIADGKAFVLLKRWDESNDRFRQAADVLHAMHASPWPAELALWDLYRDSPPPLNRFDGIELPGLAAVAFLPDGRTFLAGGGPAPTKGMIEAFDAPIGRKLYTLPGHAAPVTSIAVSRDGRTALTGSADKTLKLWDLTTRRDTQTLTGHTGPVRAVALSSDAHLAVSASDDGAVRLWDIATAKELHTFTGHQGPVRSVAISPDVHWAVSGGADKTVRVWDLAGKRAARTLSEHLLAVNAVTFSTDGREIFSASDDKTIKSWSTAGGGGSTWLYPDEGPVTALAYSPFEPRFLTATASGSITLWIADSMKIARAYRSGLTNVQSIAFPPDAWTAVSACAQGNLTLWDMVGAREARMMRGATGPVTAVALTADGSMALHASTGQLTLCDTSTARVIRALPAPLGAGAAIALSPDGHLAAAAIADTPDILLWDVKSAQPLPPLKGHTQRITSLAFSADGTTLISASRDQTLRIWDAAQARPIVTLTGHTAPVNAVAISADGKLAASASDDRTVKLWDIAAKSELRTYESHTAPVTAVALSADGRLLASAGADKLIHIWNPTSPTPIHTLHGHTDTITGLALSPDSRILLSASSDGSLRLWDPSDGRELLHFSIGRITSVAFASSAFKAASSGPDSAAIVYDFTRPQRYRDLEPRLRQAWATRADHPDDPASLATLGEWYAFRGVPKWAIPLLEQARAGGAQVSSLALARCYWEIGDAQSAKREFDLALQRNEAPALLIDLCRAAQ
jgi:WD40 repeat protein/tRNA A-37 threonylcarbamoyl transferase component Bud32